MELSIYDIIKIAYQSRLLFGTDLEYRECLGVSFETISDNREDERAMNMYYDLLNKECRAQTDESLYAMVSSYVEASDVSRSIGFDWGERRQIASRKKFVRMLFRMAAAPGVNLSVEEELKFKPKDCDKRLIDVIYPDGVSKERTIDLIFLALITFGVVKPYSANMRGRTATETTIKSMIDLVEIIREDMPQLGVLSKPLAFDSVLDALQDAQSDLSVCTPAWFWNLLNSIEEACITTASPSKVAESMLELTGYSMPGIWIDNKDEGKNRFWIFPENKYMAFCFSKESGSWLLIPYEFCFYSRKYKTEIDDICVFVTAKGNKQILSTSIRTMDKSEVVTLSYELRDSGTYPNFDEIVFESEAAERPLWFDWNSFKRLSPGDARLEDFCELVSDLYDSNSPYSSIFSNTAPFITDAIHCLIAIDNDYIYISDIRQPERFILKRDTDGSDMYWYLPRYNAAPPRNLLNIEVSEEHPLYLFPRNIVSEFVIPDKYKKFFEAVDSTEVDDQICFYESVDTGQKMICFNRFSCIFVVEDLLRDLSKFGVKRLTSFR